MLLAEDHRDLHFALRQLLEKSGATRGIGLRRPRSRGQGGLGHVRCGPDGPAHAAHGRLSGHARAAQPGCAVPIVALTADPATVRRAEALDAGCDACLSKPFKLEDLPRPSDCPRARARTGRSGPAGHRCQDEAPPLPRG